LLTLLTLDSRFIIISLFINSESLLLSEDLVWSLFTTTDE